MSDEKKATATVDRAALIHLVAAFTAMGLNSGTNAGIPSALVESIVKKQLAVMTVALFGPDLVTNGEPNQATKDFLDAVTDKCDDLLNKADKITDIDKIEMILRNV